MTTTGNLFHARLEKMKKNQEETQSAVALVVQETAQQVAHQAARHLSKLLKEKLKVCLKEEHAWRHGVTVNVTTDGTSEEVWSATVSLQLPAVEPQHYRLNSSELVMRLGDMPDAFNYYQHEFDKKTPLISVFLPQVNKELRPLMESEGWYIGTGFELEGSDDDDEIGPMKITLQLLPPPQLVVREELPLALISIRT
jgi:hypothetical protein